MRPIKILHLDDSPDEGEIIADFFGAVADVDIAFINQPFQDPRDYLNYDGVIIDYLLGPMKGIDVSTQIHSLDWRLPVAILTGMDSRVLPHKQMAQTTLWCASKADRDECEALIMRMVRVISAIRGDG